MSGKTVTWPTKTVAQKGDSCGVGGEMRMDMVDPVRLSLPPERHGLEQIGRVSHEPAASIVDQSPQGPEGARKANRIGYGLGAESGDQARDLTGEKIAGLALLFAITLIHQIIRPTPDRIAHDRQPLSLKRSDFPTNEGGTGHRIGIQQIAD